MDFQDLQFRYGYVAGRRFYHHEKLQFLRGATKEFFDMNIAVDVKEARHMQRRAYNLYAGDLEKSKIVLAACYDTPPKTFGLSKYRVFEKKPERSSFFLAVILPTLALLLVGSALLYFFLQAIWQDGIFDYKDVLATALMGIVVFLLYLCRNGLGNRSNLVRNTSSILACIMLADRLKKRERKRFALALTDYGCVNHYGDIMLHEILGENVEQKTVIFVDCIGADDSLHLLYRPGCQKLVKQLQNVSEEAGYDIQFQEISEKDDRYYLFSQKSILITAGKHQGESILVKNVNTRKDVSLSESNIEKVVFLLQTLYVLDSNAENGEGGKV